MEEFPSGSMSVFGLGYGGSVTAACFAHIGHNVTMQVIKRLLGEGPTAGLGSRRVHVTTGRFEPPD